MRADDLTTGQEVVLHDVNDRYGNGREVTGTIVKVGRVRVHIQTREGWPVEQYRIDDQSICNPNHPGAWFKTRKQETASKQRNTDLQTIQDHGFRPDRPRPSNDLVHAVAEFLRSLDTTQQTS